MTLTHKPRPFATVITVIASLQTLLVAAVHADLTQGLPSTYETKSISAQMQPAMYEAGAHYGSSAYGYGREPTGWRRGGGMMSTEYDWLASYEGIGMPIERMYYGSGWMGDPTSWDPLRVLDLSHEQWEALDEIIIELSLTRWELMGKRMQTASKLPRLYAAPRPDSKAIGQVYAEIFDLKRQMIETEIEARNRALDLLTDDQRSQLKQLWLGGHIQQSPTK